MFWSGSDPGEPGSVSAGSGVAFFDVFLSDNGSPLQPFLLDTTQTSGRFTGEDGHRYGFFSVATDNVGHRQAMPVAEQASTTVDLNDPPTAQAGPDQKVKEGDLVTLTGSFNDVDAGDTHTFLWHVTSNNGQAIADGTGKTVQFLARDNGTYTANFTVTDQHGAFASDTVLVKAANVAPKMKVRGPARNQAGSSFKLDLSNT